MGTGVKGGATNQLSQTTTGSKGHFGTLGIQSQQMGGTTQAKTKVFEMNAKQNQTSSNNGAKGVQSY